MCIFQQCWLQILKYQLDMPSEIISHLNILVFLVTHSHVWHPKLCWGLLRVLSKEFTIRVQPWWGVASHEMLNQAPHPAVSTGTSAGWRAAQGLGSLQNSPHFSHRGQREQGQSWPVGMGEDGQGQRRRQFRLNIPVLVPSACTASSELTGGVL